jgi:hypothetical protein
MVHNSKRVLSLILCSRNDQYMGNSRWRLETTLNYVAQRVQELEREEDVEVLVADWGSTVPLTDVVQLSPAAAKIVSFLAISPAIARDLQRDSPFPEVLALNAAVRRAKGEYIGRIDQDTLVGTHFLRTFFDLYEDRRQLTVPLAHALMFANRRNISYQLAAACPPLKHIERLVRLCGRLLPHGTPSVRPFWSYEVGVWLLHRDLWNECRGYDEDLIYFNWMETDMIRRLSQKYPIVNLGEFVDYDFYHLGHYSRYARPQSGEKKRKRNPVVDFSMPPKALKANNQEWGLLNLPLQTVPVQADIRSARARDGGSEPGMLSLLVWLMLAACRAAWDQLMFRFVACKRSLQIARSTIKGKPMMALPRALATLCRKRFGRSAGSVPCD